MTTFSFGSHGSLFLSVTAAAAVTIGCGSAVAEAETDAAGSSSSASAATTAQPPATTSPEPATTTPPDPSTTTTAPPEPGTTTTGEGEDESSSSDGGFIPKSDAGVAPTGLCVGSSSVGSLGTVHSLDGLGTQTQCTSTPGGCGGDVVGTWTFEDHCGLESFPNFFESQCPESTMTYVGSEVSGTRLFAEDGTFALDRTLVLDATLQLDSQGCFGVGCEAFGELVSDDGLQLACADAVESGCDCTLQIAQATEAMGTYEADEDGLTLTVNGEPGAATPYCVADGELQIWEALSSSTVYDDTMCDVAEDCERELGDVEDTWFCANG